MGDIVRHAHMSRQAACAPRALVNRKIYAHSLCMARPRNTYIKEWRKFRGLTQEALAARLNVSHSSIGRLENGKIEYTQHMLEAVADALNCAPADLLMRDPSDPEGIWTIWDSLKPPQRRQAVAVLQAMKATGTDG